MKKRFIRLFMFATVIAGMGVLNSCKDYDEDHYNDLQYKLQEQAKEQKAALEALQADFDAKLAAIKQCSCVPVDFDAKINDALKAYAAQHPDGISAKEAAEIAGKAIEEYLAAHPEKTLTAKEVEGMISSALANFKCLTAEEVANMIATALANIPTLSADDVETIVTNALTDYVTMAQLNAAKEELNGAIDAVQDALDAKADKDALDLANQAILGIQSKVDEAAELAGKNETAIQELKELVEGLEIKDWTEDIKDIRTTATNAKDKAEDNYLLIVGLDNAYQLLSDKIDAMNAVECYEVKTKVDSLAKASINHATKEDIVQTKAYAYDLFLKLIKPITEDIIQLQTDLKELNTKVEKYRTELLNKIEDLRTDLNSMITDIIIQGAENPIFGTFAMPGVDPNVLMAYCGENLSGIKYFPEIGDAHSVNHEVKLTEKDAEMLGGLNPIEVVDPLIDAADDNAGKLYLTINPNTVNFNGKNVELVNSLDAAAPITLGKLKKVDSSDEPLKFGWTRSVEDNGLYVADAKLEAESISAAKIDLMDVADIEAIISTTPIDKKKIIQNVLSMLDGMLDANAVKATWEDTQIVDPEADPIEHVKHSVYSQYSIAAAAVQPLSFNFLSAIGQAQVCMLYKNADLDDKLHHVSNNPNPALCTDVKVESGDAAEIELCPSTYNLELVAPAYKKFVAVTNVFKSDTFVSAQDGDPDCKQALIEANSATNLNEVIPGSCNGITFNVKKGYRYEIIYCALDYSGFISQNKYWILGY